MNSSKKLKILAGIALLVQLNPLGLALHFFLNVIIMESTPGLIFFSVLFSGCTLLLPVAGLIKSYPGNEKLLINLNIAILVLLVPGALFAFVLMGAMSFT